MWIKYLLVSFMLHNKEIRDFVDLRIPMQLVWVAAQKTGQRVKCQRSVNCALLIINSPSTALKKSKVNKFLSFSDAIILNTWKEKLGWPQRKQHLSGHLHNHQNLSKVGFAAYIRSTLRDTLCIGKTRLGDSPVFPVALPSTYRTFHCFHWLWAITHLEMFYMSVIHAPDSLIWLLEIAL